SLATSMPIRMRSRRTGSVLQEGPIVQMILARRAELLTGRDSVSPGKRFLEKSDRFFFNGHRNFSRMKHSKCESGSSNRMEPIIYIAGVPERGCYSFEPGTIG